MRQLSYPGSGLDSDRIDFPLDVDFIG